MAKVSVFTRRHGRKLVVAGGSGSDPTLPPAPFEATGLACRTCYDFALDMPEVTWELAQQHRMRRIRALYRQRRR